VLYIGIDHSSVNFSTVVHLIVIKLEHVAINYSIAIVFKDLEENCFVIGVNFGAELSIGQEILSINAMILLVL
jgi:hypothetical protein